MSLGEKFYPVSDSFHYLTRAKLSIISFRIPSPFLIIISTFAFLFSETALIFLYSRLPKSAGKRLSKIHIHIQSLPHLRLHKQSALEQTPLICEVLDISSIKHSTVWRIF